MRITKERFRRGVSVAGLVMLSGALTASYRFLATAGFSNDHFIHLSAAQQMLFGDWPTRDFIDIGRPLTIVASAVAQFLLGRTLFAEAVLVSAAFGIAAALTAAIVFELTGSLFVAFGAAAVEAAAFPRTYAYPKILATAVGLWLIGYFLRRPSLMRQTLMAAGVMIAFLFRHDLGLFVGAGGLAASILGAPTASWQERLRYGITFAAMAFAMVVPYLAYVQLTETLWNYFSTALNVNANQPGYVWPNPFAADAAKGAQLLYLFHFLPVAAMGICVMDWKRGRDRWCIQFLISVAVVAVAENFGLMRHPVWVRVPDAIVPAVVLGAWLARRAWLARSQYLRMASVAVLLGAGVFIGDVGNISENLNRASWLEPWRLPGRFADRSTTLRDRFGGDLPSRVIVPLKPFFAYVDRCTTDQHRLFLVGFIPEVAYYARRPFAGGAHEYFTFWLPGNQQRIVAQLRRELVPFALMPSEVTKEVEGDLPIVAGYFRGRYSVLTDIVIYEDRSIRILIDDTLPSNSRDAETGWPCFR